MRAALAAALAVLVACASAQAGVGDVWVADTEADTCGANIWRVDPAGHTVNLLTPAGAYLRAPSDIAASPDGNTLWVADAKAFDTTVMQGSCDDGPGGIVAVDTTTGAQTVVSSAADPGTVWGGPKSIAFDAVHNRLVVLNQVGSGFAIDSVNLVNRQQTVLVATGALGT